ncbi:hypothetical protein PVAP13_3KG238500 [Panicum virgatum]|uniref:Uncharacterized protein n=1 Tax=Panicum virgatum TaxID=38727 RepID=A0A8T0V2M7_PANVG|nr:hypothetical protein PVAP13_3KG238500 [Panicum virgatum]
MPLCQRCPDSVAGPPTRPPPRLPRRPIALACAPPCQRAPNSGDALDLRAERAARPPLAPSLLRPPTAAGPLLLLPRLPPTPFSFPDRRQPPSPTRHRPQIEPTDIGNLPPRFDSSTSHSV